MVKYCTLKNEAGSAGPERAAMALVLLRAIAQFAQPVEEHRPGQCVFHLALIEPDVDASPQLDAADVLEQERRPFNLAKFSQCDGQTVFDAGSGTRRPPAVYSENCICEATP